MLTHPSAQADTFITGVAFRMAQDLGFQQDSELWPAHAKSFNSREDHELRRRIYWGCYLSDKLISLVFGRPVQLKYSEAEVRDLETLPLVACNPIAARRLQD
jgi:hypothetical protein